MNLVPVPRSVQVAEGAMDVTEQSRIVTSDEALLPLAGILADEISLVAGVKPAVGRISRPPDNRPRYLHTFSADLKDVHGRYVKVVGRPAGSWLFVDEIFVNPGSKSIPD